MNELKSFVVLAFELAALSSILLALKSLLGSRKVRIWIEAVIVVSWLMFLSICEGLFLLTENVLILYGLSVLLAAVAIELLVCFKQQGLKWKSQFESKWLAMVLIVACLVVVGDKIYRKLCRESKVLREQDAISQFAHDVSSDSRSFAMSGRHSGKPASDEPFGRRAKRARNVINFYGVSFGGPSGLPTNDLVRIKATRYLDGGKGGASYSQYFWSGVDETLRPSCLFDFAEIHYSYETVTPESARFYARFPKSATRSECIELLGGFEAEMKSRYGIILKDTQGAPNAEEPADFVPCEAPPHVVRSSVRYTCPSGSEFYHREFIMGELFGSLIAGETRYGERCAILCVFDISMGDRKGEGIVE